MENSEVNIGRWLLRVVLLSSIVVAAAGCEVFLPDAGGPGQPCVSGKCRDGLACVDNVCVELTDECSDGNDGAPCAYSDECTSVGFCQEGACVAGPPDKDEDGDGYVDAQCEGGDDCNDSDASINPGVQEALATSDYCKDDKDNDCDGQADGEDPGCLIEERFCTAGWCWYNPLPAGNTWEGAWSVGNKTWIVGDGGAVILLDTLGGHPGISMIDTGADIEMGGDLNAVWASADNDVWAAGEDGVVHFDGTSWSFDEANASQELMGIWGSSADDIYAVGKIGTLVHWDGSGWTNVTPQISKGDLNAISGYAADDIWAVGTKPPVSGVGPIFHFDGTSWSNLGEVTGYALYAVAATGQHEAIAVGDQSIVVLCPDTTNCNSNTYGETSDYKAVAVDSKGTVYFGGKADAIVVYKEGAFSTENSGQDFAIHAMAVDGDDNIIAAGFSGGLMVKMAGPGTWSSFRSGFAGNVVALSGNMDVLYASLSNAILVLDPNDGSMSILSMAPDRYINDVAAGDGEQVWAVGDDGLILKCYGRPLECTEEHSGTNEDLTGVAFSLSTRTVWAVGSYGTVMKKEGDGPWQQLNIDGNPNLFDVWVGDSAGPAIVGNAGNMFLWDGSEFVGISTGTLEELSSVWGTAADNLWAVGRNNTVIHYFDDGSGSGPKAINMNLSIHPPFYPPVYLRSVWGISKGDVWISGDKGTLLHWDGTDLKQVRSGTNNRLDAVWCRPVLKGPTCWIGGLYGTILGSTW
ncbi:MAG: hypothetical protein D6806_18225 [Deltaproteobacteria bacterium]|nr:MAG: hypothetical protein D6806_18225 [Deltaproteobacteria bacterium]